MFSLPSTAIADILGNVSSIFVDLSPIVTLVLGVSLGFFVVANVIDMVRESETKKELAQVLRENDELLE